MKNEVIKDSEFEEDQEVYLNLNILPSSIEARTFTGDLASSLWALSRVGKGKTGKFHRAAGSVAGALLRSAMIDPKAFLYRMMDRDSFKGEQPGYFPFKGVTDAMEQQGLLLIERGYRGGRFKGRATKFRATPKLIKLAESFGVSLADWAKHYRWLPRPAFIAEPLVLKTASVMEKGKRLKGVRIPVDLTQPKAMALSKQVNELNAFFAPVPIEPDGSHHAFQRVFNQADLPGFDFDKGGRFYSVGHSYQHMSNDPRKAAASAWGIRRGDMKINGEPIVEIDIRASHLTILHALLGIRFDPHIADPYEHPSIPRDVVKGWVTMTLGHDRFQRCWSKPNKEKYRESELGTGDLQKDYPIAMMKREIPKLLPVLNDWEGCPVRWGDLQYKESCAVIDAVYELAMIHGIPALPVHDSIIVPVSKEKVARATLMNTFHKHVRVAPVLTTK